VSSAIISVGKLAASERAVDHITEAQRYHQDGDMWHDALRADVFDALLVGHGGLDSLQTVRDQLAEHVRLFKDDLAHVQSLDLTGEPNRALDHSRDLLLPYIALAEKITTAALVDRNAAMPDLPAFLDLFQQTTDSQATVTTELAKTRNATQESYDNAEKATERRIVLASFAALAGVIFLMLTLRRLARPIDALAYAAERLGAGDFSVRSEASGLPEVDKVTSAFNTTAERLGDLVARERAFTADASHQLRTPMTGLRLRLERALYIPGADSEAALEESIGMLDHLESTVEGLLSLARDDRTPREPLDVVPLVSDIATRFRRDLLTRGRELVIKSDDDMPMVPASPVAIGQILDVLLANASIHGAGTVTVQIRDVVGAVSIEVSDQGPGVTGDTERIFVRRSESAKGYGIGLALARSLATAEGGRLVLQGSGQNPTFALVFMGVRP
jgi:signal transduction histidine kinase